MSKELEALKSFEIIKEMYEYFVEKYRDLEPKLMICEKEDFDNVETALKEYEDAKKHIEALNKERIENCIKLKALEIIKEKGTLFFVDNEGNPNTTEEERKILKEVL